MTVNDALNILGYIRFRMDMFGYTAAFAGEYNRRIAALQESAREELGVKSYDDAMKLPGETVLGPRTEEKVLELKNWFDTPN